MEHPMLLERRGGLRRAVAAFVLVASGLAGQASAATFDWCTSVVVRPDQYLKDPKTCTYSFSDAEIGAGADAVLFGDFTDVSAPRVAAPGRSCDLNPSHVSNARYSQRLRAAAGTRPLNLIHLSRFELVPYTMAALPGFDAKFLLTTTTPWSAVTGFFANDRSSACVARGCSLNDSWTGLAGRDTNTRLRDYIDRSGGTNYHQKVVYYLVRPDGTGVYYPTAAIANLMNPGYRAFRVVEAAEALRVGGYDAVELNQKLSQYQLSHWIAGPFARDVAQIQAQGDTFWTAQPTAYGYSQYVQGWHALSQDLKRAGVPYSITIGVRHWVSDKLDDTTTPNVNEAALIREVMKGAKILLLDRVTGVTAQADIDRATRELTAHGVRVIPMDQSCDLAILKKLEPPAPPHVSK